MTPEEYEQKRLQPPQPEEENIDLPDYFQPLGDGGYLDTRTGVKLYPDEPFAPGEEF